MLQSAPCLNTFQRILEIEFIQQRRLLCYLSGAWSWERRGTLTLGRHLCAVDHDSMRVWFCTSLQNKLYLLSLPVSWLLEGAPNPPPKALQEGCSGCAGGRQLCDGERQTLKDVHTLTWLILLSYMETSLITVCDAKKKVFLWSNTLILCLFSFFIS